MTTKQKIKNLLLNLDIVVAGINLVVLVVLTFTGVIFRYILSDPIIWVEEVQLACMVWVVFAAAGAAFRTGNHVSVEILTDVLPKPLRKIIAVIIDICFVGIMFYFMKQSLDYVEFFVTSGRVSNILKLPYKYVYTIVPLSCILMIINYVVTRRESIIQAKIEEEADYE